MVTKGTKPKSAKGRVASYRERLVEQGFKRVEVYVKADQAPLIQFIAAGLRNGAIAQLGPASTAGEQSIKSSKQEEKFMDAVSTPWNIESLKIALENSDDLAVGEFSLSIDEGAQKVLEVGVEPAGGLVVYISIEGEQVISTTVLWPCDEQEDSKAFEAMMLRKHKVFMPLCALSIENIGGREYYEIFGAMSSRSVLASMIMEIRTIANCAIELAAQLGPTKMKTSA